MKKETKSKLSLKQSGAFLKADSNYTFWRFNKASALISPPCNCYQMQLKYLVSVLLEGGQANEAITQPNLIRETLIPSCIPPPRMFLIVARGALDHMYSPPLDLICLMYGSKNAQLPSQSCRGWFKTNVPLSQEPRLSTVSHRRSYNTSVIFDKGSSCSFFLRNVPGSV